MLWLLPSKLLSCCCCYKNTGEDAAGGPWKSSCRLFSLRHLCRPEPNDGQHSAQRLAMAWCRRVVSPLHYGVLFLKRKKIRGYNCKKNNIFKSNNLIPVMTAAPSVPRPNILSLGMPFWSRILWMAVTMVSAFPSGRGTKSKNWLKRTPSLSRYLK